jgi:16S rRNA (uracil1498-N3)-methyltransferase
MTFHRFFLPPGSIDADRVTIPEEQRKQIQTVLRLRPGARIVVLDGTGSEYIVRLTEEGGAVEERRDNLAEPAVQLSLYQANLKASRLELVLQKCTEIGVSRFVPVDTARSVASEPGSSRRRRYQAIIREAAEQSGRGLLPRLDSPMRLEDALADAAARGPVVLPYEEETALRLDFTPLPQTGEVSLVIGPEGGFAREEVASAREAGAHVITLGPRILRAETAAIVASALILARIEGTA